MTASQLSRDIEQKRGDLKALFDAHKNEAGEYTHAQEQIDEINRRNDELGGLVDQYTKARALEEVAAQNDAELKRFSTPDRRHVLPGNGGGAPDPDAMKTLGQRFTESAAYKSSGYSPFAVDVPKVTLKSLVSPSDAEVKTLLERGNGWDPFVPRQPRVVLSAQRRLVVADLIPQDEISVSSVKFMEETTFTNAAASVSEGAAKPESALKFTERSQPVEKIATWLPVTEEQLADVPQAKAIIDNRLTLMLGLSEEVELLTGSGTSPHLQGFLTKTGIQSQAKGSDPVPDAIYKAMTLVRYTGFADPTGVVMHPNDWQDVRLLRTADGLYIWGSPAEAGPERVWGLPVVVTPAETENTALLGDFQMYSQLFRREGIRIEVSNSHGTYFVENKLAIRAEERLVLVIYRAAAFAKVTGI